MKLISRLCTASIFTIAAVLVFSTLGMAQAYQQTNFVSDISGLAPTPDGHLLGGGSATFGVGGLIRLEPGNNAASNVIIENFEQGPDIYST